MIAILGVGAIGGVCAAHLVAQRDDLVCCVRRPFASLVWRGPQGPTVSRPRVELQPSGLGPADWVLLATKAHQVHGAGAWLDALVGPLTRIAVLQNGVEQVARVADWAPPARVVPVVVDCPAHSPAPGRVDQRQVGVLSVPDAPAARDFAALLADTPLRVEVLEDWTSAAWQKLCVNAVGGALAALSARPLPALRHPRRAELARGLALECGAVARALGADLPEERCERIAADAVATRRGGRPSILADRLAGRLLEVDARNGAVVRFAERLGLAVPLNARASALLAGAHRRPRADLLPALTAAL